MAARGFAVPDRPGIRLRTLEDLFAYAGAEGVELRIDGTEVQVRRPKVGRPGRKAFVSGKKKQNTIKTTTFSDGQGRTLFSGVVRPGRMHDQTAVRSEGIAEQFRQYPDVRPRSTKAIAGWPTSFLTRSTPHRRSPRTTPRWASTTHGTSDVAISPRHGSMSSTPTPSTNSGGPCSGSPAAARPTRKPTSPSPDWSPTAPPAGPRDASPAPNSCSPGRPSADHPQPTRHEHAPTSIAPKVVSTP